MTDIKITVVSGDGVETTKTEAPVAKVRVESLGLSAGDVEARIRERQAKKSDDQNQPG